MFRKNEKNRLAILKDLEGKPYKFYRGGSLDNISMGRFFCSCFDLANNFRFLDCSPVFETEIAVRNPLILDAAVVEGYSSADRLYVYNCTLYPEDKKSELAQYAKEKFNKETLSTDEILCWARKISDIDAVIIKNIVEGNPPKIPVYDVMIWHEENLYKVRNVANKQNKFEKYRANTFKRVDLSAFIDEEEKDGMVSTSYGDGYIVEHLIYREKDTWGVSHEMVIKTDVPVEVYCDKLHGVITADLLEPGIYSNAHGLPRKQQFFPYQGSIRIKDVMQNCEYAILLA